MISRFQFYMREQHDACYLMITPACRMHGGLLHASLRGKGGNKAGTPSWDHIYPRPRTRAQANYQLLACTRCNSTRSNKPATAAHIALAEKLLEEWQALWGTHQTRRAQQRKSFAALNDDHCAAADAAHRPYCVIGSKRHFDAVRETMPQLKAEETRAVRKSLRETRQAGLVSPGMAAILEAVRGPKR